MGEGMRTPKRKWLPTKDVNGRRYEVTSEVKPIFLHEIEQAEREVIRNV